MSRRLTADHTLFNECINVFRPNEKPSIYFNYGPSHSFLLTSFSVPTAWQLPCCTVNPSIDVRLPGANLAFICKVENPEWVDTNSAHLYGTALSAIVSFISGRVCKSTRDNNLCNSSFQENRLPELAILHPVLVAGPRSSGITPSEETLKRYTNETTAIITKLRSIPHSKFVIVMQSIRLVQLSLLNKRDDFGLAYLLIVSAIESAAQKAIKLKSPKNPKEAEWKKFATTEKAGKEFSELLEEYKNLRNLSNKGDNIKEQYIEFINTFAPTSEWEQVIRHPWHDFVDSHKGNCPDNDGIYTITKKIAGEKFPSDLNSDEVRKILSDSYVHRSCYVHRGEQPPHFMPNPMSHFFQIQREYWPETTEKILPNYELLVGIAQRSIVNWLNTIQNEKTEK